MCKHEPNGHRQFSRVCTQSFLQVIKINIRRTEILTEADGRLVVTI
ncbi:hypothetical protein M5W70_11920 [Paenibacillus larvae]|uniref:Uncharacterized protein n=1 Tax=Paenibacillus larvae TaxID=1464 RepID=A0AAP5JPS4_9BACL|nr:hypothetical protein [Paenibacillus larvae]MCY9689393.1 hypothetical protein [Paenibacillus larvae]MDT2249872.1 hypothetical protein [Paenibacillus larvae]MDV3486177.1 hypothetical protein [Paenibacillus larvae]